MAKKRAPRTTPFEYFKGNDGLWYCHLRSGREILFPQEGVKRKRAVFAARRLMLSRTEANTPLVEIKK